MHIVALLESLPVLGGGEKYALMLLGELAHANRVTVLFTPRPGFAFADIPARLGFDPGAIEYVPFVERWSLPRLTVGADLFLNFGYSLFRTRARRHVHVAFFPFPFSDSAPAPVRIRLSWAWSRFQVRYHQTLDRLDPELFNTSSPAYLRRHGVRGAWRSLPLLLLRKLGRRTACHRYNLGRRELRTYEAVIAISHYVAEWVRQRFGKPSLLLYPAVDTRAFRPGPKRRMIVSVGRFQPAPGSKKFEALIEAFRRLTADGSAAGWELVLCGGTDGSAGYDRYLGELRTLAAGLNVRFAVNVSFAEIADLYARASVYWHAMGYGEDAEVHPERYEHFGISTVEAMAAGCVPMVINGGGQPEIVTDGVSGYLWNDPDELAAQFHRFVELPEVEADHFRAATQARAEEFSLDAFRRNVAAVFAELGVPLGRPAKAQ